MKQVLGLLILAVVFLLSAVLETKAAGVEITRIQRGDGRTFPRVGQTVTVHYTGTLVNGGKKFDSSRDRGTPFTVVIGRGNVIKCWDQGIAQLSVGERAVLRCPSELAYGARGFPGSIPPNSALDFDVELISVR